MTTPLLPCPFCGDASVEIVGDSSTDWYCVVCCGCDIRTRLHDTTDEAVAVWNRRDCEAPR